MQGSTRTGWIGPSTHTAHSFDISSGGVCRVCKPLRLPDAQVGRGAQAGLAKADREASGGGAVGRAVVGHLDVEHGGAVGGPEDHWVALPAGLRAQGRDTGVLVQGLGFGAGSGCSLMQPGCTQGLGGLTCATACAGRPARRLRLHESMGVDDTMQGRAAAEAAASSCLHQVPAPGLMEV